MELTFSWAWFFAGLLAIIASAVFMRFHEWVANNFGSGVSDYERYKLYALIGVGVGFLIMTNLLPIILNAIFSELFGG